MSISKGARAMLNSETGQEYIRGRVKDIAEMAGDFEIAHSAEDRLFEDALEAIASGASHPHKIAKEVLKAKQVKFNRVCA